MTEGKVAVKLSGDGAQFSRTSSFVLLSFSLPSLSDNMLSGHSKIYSSIKSKFYHTSHTVAVA